MPPWLHGVRVLDLSVWRPGPYATSLLVGLGADVVKIELPGGDPMRQYPALFESVNAGKRSWCLDLRLDDDRRAAHGLAAEADVVVEGFRPGALARFGLDEPGVRRVNPGAVYCSISGYGQSGARSAVPGHDLNYQAWAGALSPEGGPAVMPPLPLADLAAGMTAAFGICGALLGRLGGGPDAPGSYLDISMTDVLATWTGAVAPSEGRGAPKPGPVPGYGLFPTADGAQLALGIVSEQPFWDGLCQVLDLPDLAGLAFAERRARGTELQARLGAALATRERDDLLGDLLAAGVPVAPVVDRAAMPLAAAPFDGFPFAVPGGGSTRSVGPAPQLDEHRGQGFTPRTNRGTPPTR